MTKRRCECDADTMDNPNGEWMYEPEEKKAMRHVPDECPGDYKLKEYVRDGKRIWLCSCCYLSSDIPVEELN